jgi:WD40 repeat protein
VQGVASPTTGRPGATVAASPAILRNGEVAILRGHTGPVSVVAWSPDGSRFATSSGTAISRDFSVRLWRADGTPIATWTQPDTVRALAWSPDGKLLASGSAEGTLRLSDAEGTLIRTLDVGKDPLLSLAWSPDGQILAVGGFQRPAAGDAIPGVVRLVRPDGRVIATMQTERTGGKFLHLAWSPDSATLVGGAIDFYLWRADGTLVARLLNGAAPAPALDRSPDGTVIAIGDENGLLHLYGADGTLIATVGEAGGSAVRDVAFSPDGRTLAMITDVGVRFVDPARPKETAREIYRTEGGPWSLSVSNLVWSPDGSRLAAATPEGALRVWRADGTPLVLLTGCSGFVERIAWSPDGMLLVAGGQDGAVCRWKV